MKCCICKKEIPTNPLTNWNGGNNALPVYAGRCCDNCDTNVVIPARMKYMLGMKTLQNNPNESFAVVLEPNGKISLYKGKNKNEFLLEELQAMVDGLIEVYPSSDEEFTYLVNEEGLLRKLSPNHLAYHLLGIQAVGSVVIIPKNMLK